VHTCEKLTTYSEPIKEVFSRAIDVKPPAYLLDLIKCQLLVSCDVSTLPVLFLPYPLPLFDVSQPNHELEPVRMQSPQRGVPHAKYVLRGGDEVQYFVVPIENIDDCQPECFVFLSQLKVMSM